jgi:ArsR family transcriptional regulator, arsenate/arsenite/antimonite-responsive transcriptional repressor
MHICVYVYEAMKKNNTITLPPAFRAMADVTRLKILLMLEAKPRTVGEIVSFFALSQPTISRHLHTLTTAGLVRRTRSGQHVLYELNVENLKSICVGLIGSFDCCGLTIQMRPGIVTCDSCGAEKAPENTEAKRKTKKSNLERKGGRR